MPPPSARPTLPAPGPAPQADLPGLEPEGPASASLLRHPRAQQRVCLAGCGVDYELVRVRRRSIGMVVGPDGLSVRAPRWVGLADIETALQGKARWILLKLGEQRERLARQAAAHIEWAEGAELPYLGAPLRLVLGPGLRGAEFEPAAPGQAARLRLGLPPGAGPGQWRDAVQAWLMRRARERFQDRLEHFAPRLGVQPRRLALSAAATRWGSASADGSIRLNWRLIHLSPATIDYVVVHELAHLRHMDHGPGFWDVVRGALPDFDQARAALRDPLLPAFD